MIDFLAVLPYYLEFVLPKAEEEVGYEVAMFFAAHKLLSLSSLSVSLQLLESGGLAGLRLIRIFRLLKMFRFMSQVRYVSLSFEVAGESIRKSIGPLFPMFAAGAISVIILSTLIYYAERGVEDTKLGYRVDANGNKRLAGWMSCSFVDPLLIEFPSQQILVDSKDDLVYFDHGHHYWIW